MIKIFSGKLWITLTSIIVLCTGIAFACAFDNDEEYGTSNFTPEVFVNISYSPFFYSNYFYYQVGFETDQNTRFNENNIIEWMGYFDNKASHGELAYLLEKASPASIDSTLAYVTGKSSLVPIFVPSFDIFKQKNQKKLAAFLNYLRLAKQSEAFAVRDRDSWEYDRKIERSKKFDASDLDKELKKNFSKSKDIFLKERYWFQLIRSYFFNNSPNSVIEFFDKSEKKMPRNTMYYRALGYTAGAYYKLKNYSRANYYYGKVYDSCYELKMSAHFSFHPQEEADWKGTLALCQNKDEQATLWQMLGVFYGDENRAITNIYQLNPASDKLNLLLARAVNRYEQKFNNDKDDDIDILEKSERDSANKSHETLHQLVVHIALAGNANMPWVWDLAAGYLNTLDENYDSAKFYYDKAEKILPDNEMAQAQLRLLKIINKIASVNRIDGQFENEILGDIEWLRNFDYKKNPEFRYQAAFSWLKQKLASKYKEQNELEKSECFYSVKSFYAEGKNVEAMKTFLSNPSKTPYEKLCAELSDVKLEDIFEFEAVQLTYQNRIEEAIGKMEKIGHRAETELLGNPFNGRIQDCHDCDFVAAQKIKYTKISFLKKLKELKDKTDKGDDVFNNAMLLAHAHYNICHYGNARVFYECKILGGDQSSPFYLEDSFKFMLLDMDMADKYYRLSLTKAITDEQKAKCQYMLAKCERNKWYNLHVYNNRDNEYGEDKLLDFSSMSTFKALKQYSSTQYYKDIIKECGYFHTYIAK